MQTKEEVLALTDELLKRGVSEIEFHPNGVVFRIKLSPAIIATREVFNEHSKQFWTALGNFLSPSKPDHE